MPTQNFAKILDDNPFCRLLGIEFPICQAGMYQVAHGRLAAAVSQAGGLGVIGAAFMEPEDLRQIAAFYKIEAEIRGQSASDRLALRQEKTAPLIAEFEAWLKTMRSRISTKSRLGEKLAYIAKHLDGLKLFLDDGSVEMDSNVVERSIRPIALNRKNALFAGHDEGGRSWGRIASLIETCKLNGVEPYAYLKATLEAIAQGHPASRIDELMPWNFQKSA